VKRAALLLSAAAACIVGPSPSRGALSHLGGFHPVAPEEGARSVWVNPAAIGSPARPSTVAELVWSDAPADGATGEAEPEGLRFVNYSAGTDRSSIGVQWENDDVDGVADWTIAWGKPIPVRRGVTLGTTLEWKAGEDGKLDATVAALVPLGGVARGALVVHDVFEADVDGANTSRLWRAGLSLRSAKLLGRATYDLVRSELSGADAEHWFGLGLDRGRRVRLSYAMNLDGEWSAEADYVHESFLLGGGVLDRDGGARRIFAAVEWLPPPPRGRRGFRTISR
jgi:hypothetical protein